MPQPPWSLFWRGPQSGESSSSSEFHTHFVAPEWVLIMWSTPSFFLLGNAALLVHGGSGGGFSQRPLLFCPRLASRKLHVLRHRGWSRISWSESSFDYPVEFEGGDTPEIADGKDQKAAVFILASLLLLYGSALVLWSCFVKFPILCSLVLI